MWTWPSLSFLDGDRHLYKPAALTRWRRVFTRMAARSLWHWQGLLHWLLPRAHLRGWATPWPGTETVFQYHRQSIRLQSMAYHVSASVLLELVELRNKMGFELAFLGNDKVAEAVRIARISSGVMGRLRGAAQAERGPTSSPSASSAGLGFGPRGGLPRDKPSLQAFARRMRLDDSGTIAQLQVRIREAAERARQEAAAHGRTLPASALGLCPGSPSAEAMPAQPPEPARGPPSAEEVQQQVRQEVQQMSQSISQGVAAEVLRLLLQGAVPPAAAQEGASLSEPGVETFDLTQMDPDGLMEVGSDYSFPSA